MVCPDTSFDWGVLHLKTESVSKYGKGLGDLAKYSLRLIEEVATQRDLLTQWDNIVMGPKQEKSNAIYVSTGETYEMAYVRLLCGDDMPEGPEAALTSFRKVRNLQVTSTLTFSLKIEGHGIHMVLLSSKYSTSSSSLTAC